MKKYAIIVSIVISILLLSFGFYFIYSSNNNKEDIGTLKSKVNAEIQFLDRKIIYTMNRLNNISYIDYKVVEQNTTLPKDKQSTQSSGGQESSNSGQGGGESSSGGSGEDSKGSEDNSNKVTISSTKYTGILQDEDNKIDWKIIKKEVEQMYSSWTNILIDLNALNVNQNNLLKYNTVLDMIAKSVEAEDKKACLRNYAELYGLVASYVRQYSDDIDEKNLYDTKSNVLYAYSLAEYDNKWIDMAKYINNAQSAYTNITNNSLQNTSNISSINKAYVLLNELEKNVASKNRKIFYINYKNLMTELEIID